MTRESMVRLFGAAVALGTILVIIFSLTHLLAG